VQGPRKVKKAEIGSFSISLQAFHIINILEYLFRLSHSRCLRALTANANG
jgi:hypothetical protein